MSLRARLAIGTVCTLAVAICLGLVAAYVVVRAQLRNEIDRSLTARAASLVSLATEAPGRFPAHVTSSIRLPPPKLGGAAGYTQFVDGRGKIWLVAGESTQLPTAGVSAVASGERPAFLEDASVADTNVRIYVTRLGNNIAVEIARPLT